MDRWCWPTIIDFDLIASIIFYSFFMYFVDKFLFFLFLKLQKLTATKNLGNASI